MKQSKFEQTGGLTYAYMPEVLAKPYGFYLKKSPMKQQYQQWPCSICGKLLDNLASRGMEKKKCDDCKKETVRLKADIRYWEQKVGVKVLETS